MSTRAHIGILNNDGTVREIYHHYDGYLEGLGSMLTKFYGTEDRINKLLDLGDMSEIGEEPIGYWKEYEPFEKRDYIKCMTYRERGEKNVDACTYKSVDDFLNNCQEDFTYLFKDGQWYYREWSDKKLRPVPIC